MSGTDPVIYDFGMNNGDDVEYYLLKGPRVVGVEANRSLCEEVRKRFPQEIASGRLTVLNVALSGEDRAEPLTFYIHKTNHVLSQLPPPPAKTIDEFEPVQVACRTPASIVEEFGPPCYVKIDVEHYDQVVLENLFSSGIYPPEISAESHSIEIFSRLVLAGYNSFSLVEGNSVSSKYRDTTIATPSGPRKYSFRGHTSGPFGEDIRAPWEDRETFFHTLALAGLGWKDIHASNVIAPVPAASNWTIARRRAESLALGALRAVKWRTIDRLTGRNPG
jgi:FkbM family methyltransferase